MIKLKYNTLHRHVYPCGLVVKIIFKYIYQILLHGKQIKNEFYS